jgi:branched-chain amino acid aminotransferase
MEKRLPKYLLFKGSLVEYDKAKVHVLSTAVKYGAVVFEGLRAYWNNDRQELYGFRFEDHFRRLNVSMRIARIPGPTDVEANRDALLGLVRANELREDLHLRVQVFVEAPDSRLNAMEPISVSMAAIPMGRYFEPSGLNVSVSSWTRTSDRSIPPRVKAISNYMNSRLALIQAQADGYDDTLLLTPEGKVAEGPGHNVFIVRDGELLTPPVTDGILEGITRDSAIKLARRLGIHLTERSIDRTELYQAEEIFVCGSAAEVTPVVSVDRIKVASGAQGPMTDRIRQEFLATARGQRNDDLGWLNPVYAGAGAPVAAP